MLEEAKADCGGLSDPKAEVGLLVDEPKADVVLGAPNVDVVCAGAPKADVTAGLG